MGENKIIDGIIEKVPQVKEAINKVEDVTGKKIENIASEIGEKITDVVKEKSNGDTSTNIGDFANKFFGKK